MLLTFFTTQVFPEIKDANFLADFIRAYDVKLKAEDRCVQVIDSPEAIELIAEEDDSLLELQFTEEQDKVKYYPPLAPIKPQLAASMLAGGMGGYAHEVLIDGDRYSIKAASIKEVTTRELIINGKEVKESVEAEIVALEPSTFAAEDRGTLLCGEFIAG